MQLLTLLFMSKLQRVYACPSLPLFKSLSLMTLPSSSAAVVSEGRARLGGRKELFEQNEILELLT